jgi:hypothetical protein
MSAPFGTNVNGSNFFEEILFLKKVKTHYGEAKIIVTLYYFSWLPCLTSNNVIIIRIFTIFLDQNAFKGASSVTLHWSYMSFLRKITFSYMNDFLNYFFCNLL